MKKILLIFSIITFVILSSYVCYGATVPEFVVENGNTVLGTFKTSALTDMQKQFMRDWLSSDRNLLFRTNSGKSYYFVTFPVNSKYYIGRNADGSAQINFLGSCSGIVFTNRSLDGYFNTAVDYVGSPSAPLSSGLIITSTLLTTENINIPTPVDYIASWQGDFIIRDDYGLFGSENESDGLLGWLKNFWDSLLSFVKSIFIPEDGYFEKWYNDIKTAADKKFSSLSGIYNTLSGAFDSLKNTSDSTSPLNIKFPANHFYYGSPAIALDFLKLLIPLLLFVKSALTACVVIYTGITCYKYLIVLFEQ